MEELNNENLSEEKVNENNLDLKEENLEENLNDEAAEENIDKRVIVEENAAVEFVANEEGVLTGTATDITEDDESKIDDTEAVDAIATTKPAHPEAALEAILFAYGNSVSSERLCEVLCLTEEELEEAVSNLEKQYAEEGRGIIIVRLEDSFQLGTKAEYYDRLVKLAKHPKRYSLTDSVIETLSIVAYKQPVTKSEIEKIRGVSADHAINRLVEYELIEEVGRLDAPGKPLLFGTTEQFLRAFGVSSLNELPEMSEDLKETFKAEAEQEALGGDNDDGDDSGIIVDI